MGMAKGKPMTPKQQRFVQEYLIDLNATQAAIRAGYSERSAYMTGGRMMKNDEVMVAINAALAQRAQRTEITQEWVLKSLEQVAKRCLDPETFEHAGANRALELIGKHLRMFTDVVEHKGDPLAELFDRVAGRTKAGPADDSPTIQ